MSFSLVGVSGEGNTLVVNSDELPQPPPAPNFPQDTISTITPFSNFLNISSFANNFSSFSTITTAPGFSTFSNPSWNPYAPAPDQPLDPNDLNSLNGFNPALNNFNNNMLNKKRWESPSMAAAAAIRKKRKQNFFEEEEATCAKCHYRRKCMKCTTCFARFCEQRCLPRYLEDPTAQEEVKLTNTWLCPCCKGIEPPGKYKGSDVEDSKDKDGDDDDDPKPNSSSGTTQPIVAQNTPITHVTSNNFYQDQQHVNHYLQHNQSFQLQHLQLQHQQQQQQQLKMQQLQMQQQQIQQMQQQQLLLQQQQHMQLQHPFNPQQNQGHHLLQQQQQHALHPQANLQSPMRGTPANHNIQPPLLSPHTKGPQAAASAAASKTPKQQPNGVDVVDSNGTGGVGGSVVGEGEEQDPSEYPKETEDFCSVCGDSYSYDNNEIIYCDGCNVAVHQACYGVSKVPAGEWMCDRCKSKVLPTCYLCSQKGGAMKELVDAPGHWLHVTCVAAIHELHPLEFTKKLGPAGLLAKIDQRRYKLKCEICKEMNRKGVTGPLIQCKRKRCVKAFHPICSKRKLTFCKELNIFVTYCKQHATEAPQDSPLEEATTPTGLE